jgi:hypothetical protein
MVQCERSHQHADGLVHVHEKGETHNHAHAAAGGDVHEQAVTDSLTGDNQVTPTSPKTAKVYAREDGRDHLVLQPRRRLRLRLPHRRSLPSWHGRQGNSRGQMIGNG